MNSNTNKTGAHTAGPLDAQREALNAIAAGEVCRARNEWAERYEDEWLEDDSKPHPDYFIGAAVVESVLRQPWIVNSCNAHDDLVAALRDAVENGIGTTWKERARAALAKAGAL